jgi:hypothetical protein
VPIPPARHKDDRELGDGEQKNEPTTRSVDEDLDDDTAIQKAIERSIAKGMHKGTHASETSSGDHQDSPERGAPSDHHKDF